MAEQDMERLTFVLTDLVGSTRRWEVDPDGTAALLEEHDRIVASVVARHGGELIRSKGEGDSTFSTFLRSPDALRAAADVVRELPDGLEVRIGIHTGAAQRRDGDLFGSAVNRAARLRSVAHGDQIVASSVTAELAADELGQAGVELRYLGERRLRGLAGAERVFQLTGPGLPDRFPPLRWVDPLRSNLVAPGSSFVGRSDELAMIERSVERSTLTTLVGPGGSGKTRLAIEAGIDLVDRFEAGVWFVDLSSESSPDAVGIRVADAASVAVPVGMEPVRMIAEKYAGHSLLFILDNCEHLTESCARVVESLAAASTQFRVLATSRGPLHVTRESLLRVAPLRAHANVGDAPTEAVQLFVDRARAAGTDVDLSVVLATVEQICSRLDGLPLAIELAAARTRVLGLGELDDRLSTTTGTIAGPRRMDERHRTIDALIDWSYALLEPDERLLFRRLGVFRGSFTLRDIESVCTDDRVPATSVLDLIVGLVDHSLVTVDTGALPTRYKLLNVLRDYAIGRLDRNGELSTMRDRHVEAFLELARAVPGVAPNEQGALVSRLAGYDTELSAAVDHAVAAGDADAALELGACLWKYWLLRTDHEAGARLRTILDLDGGLPAHRAGSLVGLSHLGEADVSTRAEHAREAIGIAKAIDAPDLAGEAYTSLVNLYFDSDPHRAVGYARSAVDLHSRGTDPTAARVARFGLGLALANSDLPASISVLKDGLQEAQDARDDFTIQRCAHILMQIGENDRTMISYAEIAAAAAERLGMTETVRDCYQYAGQAAVRLGDLDLARRLFNEALAAEADEYVAGRTPTDESPAILTEAARALYGAGDRSTAVEFLRRAERYGRYTWEIDGLAAVIERDRGDTSSAARRLERALRERAPTSLSNAPAIVRGMVRCAASLAAIANDRSRADRWFAAVRAIPLPDHIGRTVGPYEEADRSLVRGDRDEHAFAAALDAITPPPDIETAGAEVVAWLATGPFREGN